MSKNKKYIILSGIAVILILVLAKVLTTKTTVPTPQNPVITGNQNNENPAAPKNSWNGVIPGRSTLASVDAIFGKKLAEQYVGNNLVKYQYQYRNTTKRIDVITDSKGIIQYFRIYKFTARNGRLQLEKDLGLSQPTFETYIKGVGNGEKYYVYLNDGIAVQSNEDAKDLTTVAYFVPTTQTKFMSMLDDYLTLNEEEAKQHQVGEFGDINR